MRKLMVSLVMLGSGCAAAQTACPAGEARATGVVVDVTGAVVVGADVDVAGVVLKTDAQGRFVTACAAGPVTVTVRAESFGEETVVLKPGATVTARMKPVTVETVVAAVEETGAIGSDVAGTKTLEASDIKQMADDPDEFERQLQVLAAAAGGAPGAAIVTVDGFQNGGRIPPKSSIAFIRVNPDLFSAEYARPPYQGGRVEIYTKPGQSSVHGALFTTQSAQFMNAKDPFALSKAAIGRQRYGFELSGPIVSKKSDFAVALEHRQINQFAVVNAVTLDAMGNPQSTVGNVATPQSLWQASARIGFYITPKNNATLTYTAGVNGLTNVGVGGTTLQEAGYASTQSEHVVRFSNLQTVSAKAVHETRLGYTWRYRNDTPNSVATGLQVAGAFAGGGVTTGRLQVHERDLEFDDDVMVTRKKHNLKAGVELLNVNLHESLPIGFNGTYVFGGGTVTDANGNVTTITGLQQYQRALRGQAGGQPTLYNVTVGTPKVALNQLQVVVYGQDQWQIKPRLSVSGGLRWAMQNAPTTFGNVAPRVGLAWSPDRRQKTTFHLRSGLFYGVVDSNDALTVERLNGTTQKQLLAYGPAYVPNGAPAGVGAATTAVRAPLPGLTQTPSLQSHVGVEHEFPGHWHAQGNLYLVRGWDLERSRNINAPVSGGPTGPRPNAALGDVYQYQQTGTIHGNVMFLGLDQHSLKRLQIFAGYIRMDLRGDADTDSFFPQNALSDAGETARPVWETTHHVIAFSTLQLPKAVALSMQFDAASGVPYNVTTGFDNNGDGVFNDRPFVAAAGATGTVYNTRFGALAPTGTGATIGRNAGTLPWNVHMDLNLSHTFLLPHKASKEGQSLAFNVRSTNALNHTNVTAVGGVLGSPLFGQAYAADPGRRVEAGLRWNF